MNDKPLWSPSPERVEIANVTAFMKLVNERHGVSILSENTGAHEELGECALSVNPFDIEEQAEAIHRALSMDWIERRERADKLREIVDARDPGDWVDDQLADIKAKRGS